LPPGADAHHAATPFCRLHGQGAIDHSPAHPYTDYKLS
jgi:hypothetical protein